MQKAIDDLKSRPKDERAAFAGTVAITVVAVLMVVWGFFFIKKIRSRAPTFSGPSSSANSVFDFSQIDQATQQFQAQYQDAASQYAQLQEQAAASQQTNSGDQQYIPQTNTQSSGDVYAQ